MPRDERLRGVAREDHKYLIALGGNQWHPVFGRPRDVVAAAMELVDGTLGTVAARSSIIDSAPIGPSQRRYANAALLLKTRLNPLSLLEGLQDCEAVMGRVRRGRAWRARTLDLDIVLWSGGVVECAQLTIPHPHFRKRAFVLGPAAQIVPDWRDPLSGLTLRQLSCRFSRR